MDVTTSHLDQIQRVKSEKKPVVFSSPCMILIQAVERENSNTPEIGNFALAEPAHTYSGRYHGKK
jgi:hypothetical protein